MIEDNLYKELEIKSDASAKEIRQSFRFLAKKYHPDLNKGNKDCTEKFKKVLNAYEILIDPDARKKYDLFLNNRNMVFPDSSPYEPEYKSASDILNITIELKGKLSQIKNAYDGINVNAVFTLLNHVLNPEFIYSEINSKDERLKSAIISNIVYCYHYLPSYVIENLQIKVELINYKNIELQNHIKRLIIKRKILEWINEFIKHTPNGIFIVFVLLFIMLIYGIIQGVIWILNILF